MSSEALERAQGAIELLTDSAERASADPDRFPNAAVALSNRSARSIAEIMSALLAEVARLEQERDEAQDLLAESERSATSKFIRLEDELRRQEAALAVAREREQPTREALAALLARHVALVESGDCGFWNVEEEPEVIAVRAALVDEPAADDPMCSYCEIRLSEHEVITANCEEVERDAADEPGETP